jgi:hypothetical protein
VPASLEEASEESVAEVSLDELSELFSEVDFELELEVELDVQDVAHISIIAARVRLRAFNFIIIPPLILQNI